MRLSFLASLLWVGGRLRVQALQTSSYDITEDQTPPLQRPLLHDVKNTVGHGHAAPSKGISDALFADLERFSRLVDITYCVGTTGISRPFSCVSRCKDFPTLELVETWNTGPLMTDSCGYVAVDHGGPWRPPPRRGNSLSSSKQSEQAFEEEEAADNSDNGNNKGAIIVAFRGTYSISSTIIDLSTVPQEYVPYPEPGDGGEDDGDGDSDGDGGRPREKCANCTVHMGFLASWRSARPLLLPVLRAVREKQPDRPVHLVGHSLGGAVAALAALELRLVLGWDDVAVTTFGEPRVGNEGLVSFIDKVFGLEENENETSSSTTTTTTTTTEENDADLEKRTYRRVTHAQDPIPLLPLSEWGYRSHAGEIYIDKVPLAPAPEDLRLCRGDRDARCSAAGDGSDGGDGGGGEGEGEGLAARLVRLLSSSTHGGRWRWPDSGGDEEEELGGGPSGEAEVEAEAEAETARRHYHRLIPTRFKLWQLFFAHRDYFWRLGLCVPGGDPADWGRDKYRFPDHSRSDEL